jgi:uncharacterized protein YjdB
MSRNAFWKKTALVVCMLFMVLQFTNLVQRNKVEAAASYTWNNSIPVKYPTPAMNNGKLVMFDNTHDETAGAADWVLDGGFSDFADDLVAHGYTVQEYRGVDKNGDGCYRYYDDRQTANIDTNEEVITYDAIKNADVFVMAEANRPFTIAEQAALKQFVDSGKGIYFIADHYNSDRNKNTWDSTETYDGYNRSISSTYNIGGAYGDLRNPQDATKGWLAQTFGLRFRFNAIDCLAGVSGIRSVSDSEGLTQGVQPVLMAAGSTLSIVDGNKAKGIIYFGASDTPTKWSSAADTGIYFGGEAEGAYVAISKPSLGKAAFIGDSSPIEDTTSKYKNEETGSAKTGYAGYTDAGNAARLSENIIAWLANTESYVGFDGVSHTKGTNTPTPLATIEKDQTQAEPWATPSYDPWNTDTFKANSYNAPTGTSTIVSVTGVTLDKTSATLSVGGTLILTPTIAPSTATNKMVTWSSSNTGVATVVNGVVKAVGSGTAVITVTTSDGGRTATCNVTVSGSVVYVTGVTLDKTSLSMNTGTQQTLTATVSPSNATNKNVTWTSSNSSVASVASGVVTANAAGTAVITVTTVDGAKTATCTVTVTNSGATSISEGFDSVVGTSSSITSGIPAGWTFSSGMAIYNTTGNYGASSPSIKMQATGNQITTPTFTLTAQGTLSFWIKGQGTDSVSHLLVEKYDGTSWTTVQDISSLPTTATTKTYTLAQNIKQVRFTYTKSAGNLAFDDVSIR